MSDTITETRIEQEETLSPTDDHDKFSHYVKKRNLQPGKVQVALCGKIWVPTSNPELYPICPRCKQILEELGDFQLWN